MIGFNWRPISQRGIICDPSSSSASTSLTRQPGLADLVGPTMKSSGSKSPYFGKSPSILLLGLRRSSGHPERKLLQAAFMDLLCLGELVAIIPMRRAFVGHNAIDGNNQKSSKFEFISHQVKNELRHRCPMNQSEARGIPCGCNIVFVIYPKHHPNQLIFLKS